MKTNDLINALKADAAKQAVPLGFAWWVAITAAAMMAAFVFFALIGPRTDFTAAAQTLRFLFKFVVMLTLASVAFALLQRLSRPGSDVRSAALWLALTPVMLVVAVVAELFAVPGSQLGMVWWGKNVSVCLTFIPLIGLCPLAIFLAAVRHGAPTRPGLAGAVAGLLAGSLAATFYAAHCADDSPLFVATWYSVAITGLVVLGAILGRWVARW